MSKMEDSIHFELDWHFNDRREVESEDDTMIQFIMKDMKKKSLLLLLALLS